MQLNEYSITDIPWRPIIISLTQRSGRPSANKLTLLRQQFASSCEVCRERFKRFLKEISVIGFDFSALETFQSACNFDRLQ